MRTKKCTVTISSDTHKWLKKRAKARGVSMQELAEQSLQKFLCEIDPHIPNRRTRQALLNCEKRIGLTSYENFEDLVKKLGV